MSVSTVAILLSVLAFGIILIFLRYLIHRQNMHHINRGGQLEMMVGRQVILESRLFRLWTHQQLSLSSDRQLQDIVEHCLPMKLG